MQINKLIEINKCVSQSGYAATKVNAIYSSTFNN